MCENLRFLHHLIKGVFFFIKCVKLIVAELYNENHEYLFVNEDNNRPMTYDSYYIVLVPL